MAEPHWNPRNLYLYLVCLVTLVISIFAAVNLVRSAVELAYPDPGVRVLEPAGNGTPPEEAERQRQVATDSQRRFAVLGLVGSGTTLLITGPLYVYHWRRIERERPGSRAADPGA